MTMTPAQALAALRHSRDAERDATIWTDPRQVVALANIAGVRVTMAVVDLTAQTTEYRTVGKQEVTNE